MVTIPAVLGLDLGTSQVKALLCAPDGTVLGQGTAGYEVSTPRPGWAEADPEHWWQAACTAVRAAVGPAPAEVAGLAVAGQMHGLVLCTERAVVLRPAITWLDRRAEAEAEDYQRLPGDMRARLGNAPSPGMAGSILLTDEGEGLCRLRLFYVEPMARGRGIGDALVRACLAFAREAGYRAMTLWTHAVLISARRIYAAHGFEIVATATHDDFGKPRSHGCINLAPADAAWIFEWTDPIVPPDWHGAVNAEGGTLVWTHG